MFLKIFKALGLTSLLLFSNGCTQPSGSLTPGDISLPLTDGWAIQSSVRVRAGGATISQAGFSTAGWYPATVPTTVLAALINNNVYRDPFFGKNLVAIPTEPFQNSWWYRREFTLDRLPGYSCTRLIFDGINYRANIWLNGRKIADQGSIFGTFRLFDLDISTFLQRGVNALAVEVLPPQAGDFFMGFVDWNPRPPDRNMGLFREVRLRRSGSVSLENIYVQSIVNKKTLKEATLTITAELVNHSKKTLSGTVTGEIEQLRFQTAFNLNPLEKKELRLAVEQFPDLRIQNPRLWWPVNLGEPNLYTLKMTAETGSAFSDLGSVRFGIRQVDDSINGQGCREYAINGQKVLIRGGGWTDDLFLREDAGNLEAQLHYVRHMNLNTVRLEGIWGSSQKLYEMADRLGILIMPGWSCQWEWPDYLGKPVDSDIYGGAQSPADIELLTSYLHDQVLWLRQHPSIFVWVLGSDKLPFPEAEKRYRDELHRIDPARPYLASCKLWNSEISGTSGVKMNGPYDYVTPNYWTIDRTNGGAFGFNTETGPGPQVPTLSSLKKMIPAEALWPIGEMWNYHCARNEFGTLGTYLQAYLKRYGEPKSVEEFCFKAQAANYEAMRAMFEAFGINKRQATGVVQWMLNSAWPKLYWQLYDYYLMPTGAFYGARQGCRPLQAVYHYGEHTVHLINDTLTTIPEVTVSARLLNLDSKIIFQQAVQAACPGNSARKVIELPPLSPASPVYFLSLQVKSGEGSLLAENFYWLSVKPDILDPSKTTWFVTPNKSFADYTALGNLLPVTVEMHSSAEKGGLKATLTNKSDRIAFFLELQLQREPSAEAVVPVFWDDNYISLLPGESRTIRVHFADSDLHGEKACLVLNGWNLKRNP